MKEQIHIPQDLFETIERFLRNSMTEKEQQAFLLRMEEDPELKKQVNEVALLQKSIETAALKKKLNTYHEAFFTSGNANPVTSKPKEKLVLLKKIMYASAACLVLFMGIFWFFNEASSPEKLYAKHFIPDPGLPTTMSSTSEYTFYEGMVSYKRKSYPDAIKSWESILPQKPGNDTLNYFLGVAHLANGESQKATTYLLKLQSSPDPNSIFKQDAFYYLALSYVRQGDMENAIKILKEYPSEKGNLLLKDLLN